MIKKLHHKNGENLEEQTNSKVQENNQCNRTELAKGNLRLKDQALVLQNTGISLPNKYSARNKENTELLSHQIFEIGKKLGEEEYPLSFYYNVKIRGFSISIINTSLLLML